MNDSFQPMSSTPSAAPAGSELTSTEIDARHARSLVERALSQIERGERQQAELAVRQAMHLAPRVAVIHSLAGLLALLDGDIETARIGYENAVQDFSKVSPERERLIALRMAQADHSGVEAGAFVPSLPNEIARLRALAQATPSQDFLSDPQHPNSAGPRVPYKTETPAMVAPTPAIAASQQRDTERPAFASRLEQRKRTSAWAVGVAAISAAIVAFFVMRSLVAHKPAPQAGSTPSANQVVVENPPDDAGDDVTDNSATETPAPGGAASTPGTQTPAANASDAGSTPDTPTATVTVKPLPPANTAPVATPHPAPKPKPAPATVIPGLPVPAPTPKPPTPAKETPTLVPTAPAPHDPNFPPMPPPRVSLPSAGGEKTEFPRVIPEN